MNLQDLFESTGDAKFDAMIKSIKRGTKKQATADRREREAQSRERARAAFGASPADQLSVRGQDSLREFAPDSSGDDGGDDGFSEETLKKFAAQWYNGDEDPQVEKTLMAAGWEIGHDEGYDDEPGVFVVQAGDINGHSFISWPANELRQGVAEAEQQPGANYRNPREVDYDGEYDAMVARVWEAFDNPYKGKWEKSESGSYDMLVPLPDGTNLSIMFNNEGGGEYQVEFYRNNSQEVTGEGDAQRIFATVLNAIQKFIKKYKPLQITFSASKEIDMDADDSGANFNPESRAKLYTRLVDRYAASLGYNARHFEHGNAVTYELTQYPSDSPFEEQQLDELSFLGSECTKDCSGHRAGYDWSKRKGLRQANSWSPSFNKGAANWGNKSEGVAEGSYTTEKQIMTRIRQIMYDRKLSGTDSNAGELLRLRQQLKDLRSQQGVSEGSREHGSAYDRGAADSWYGRPYNPQRYSNPQDQAEYEAGYSENESQASMRKDYGDDTEIDNDDELREGWKEKAASAALVGAMSLGTSGTAAAQDYQDTTSTPGIVQQVKTNRADQTLKYQGNSYRLVHVGGNTEPPQISKYDIELRVPMAELGFRGIGTLPVKISGDTAYVFLPNGKITKENIGEKTVPVVLIGPDRQHVRRQVRLSTSTRDPIRAIMSYYARQGMELYSVDGRRVGAGSLAETNDSRVCPECGGPIFKSRFMAEEQDACYRKVKSRYKVWPSAYASGALVQCRKKGAANWGTGGKKK